MKNYENVRDPKISRRTFLKVIAVSHFAFSGARNESLCASLIKTKQTPEINRQEEAERKLAVSEQFENYERSITRESSFKPFEKGFIWWQHVQFQYVDQESGHRYGVTISFSELKNLSRMGGIVENDNKINKMN